MREILNDPFKPPFPTQPINKWIYIYTNGTTFKDETSLFLYKGREVMLDLETHVSGSGPLLLLWSGLYQSSVRKRIKEFYHFLHKCCLKFPNI